MGNFDAKGLLLLVPSKPDVERDAMCSCWESAGGSVLRLDRFWEPPQIDSNAARIYGPDTFGLVLAQVLGLSLLEPDQRLPERVPAGLAGRDLAICSLRAVLSGVFPVFAKPLVPKQFLAATHLTAESLRHATRGLEDTTEVLISDVVSIDAEARAFVLSGEALDVAVYEGTGDASPVYELVTSLAAEVELPEAVVLDFALVDDQWLFLEANAAWGAGLNGCDPASVMPCVAAATRRA